MTVVEPWMTVVWLTKKVCGLRLPKPMGPWGPVVMPLPLPLLVMVGPVVMPPLMLVMVGLPVMVLPLMLLLLLGLLVTLPLLLVEGPVNVRVVVLVEIELPVPELLVELPEAAVFAGLVLPPPMLLLLAGTGLLVLVRVTMLLGLVALGPVVGVGRETSPLDVAAVDGVVAAVGAKNGNELGRHEHALETLEEPNWLT
ncbi:MAG: hypothetical protein M1826_000942 [Phylliscum demangeonii]|nr:MAG: hypothetical protein M1826_000942 [Phylliscum demangeonii]